MNDTPTLRAFLDRVASVVRLGPRDHVAVERLMRSRASWASDELRAALASVLARSSGQWQRIAAIYDEVVGEAAASSPGIGSTLDGRSTTPATYRVGLHDPREHRSSRGPWLASAKRQVIHRLSHAPRWLWATVIGLVVVVPLAVAWIGSMPDPVVAASPVPSDTAGPKPEAISEHEGVVLIPVELDHGLDRTVVVQPPELPLSTWMVLALLSSLVVALGLSWIRLPAAHRTRQVAARRAQAARAETRRLTLQKRKARAGRALGVRYHVDLHLPISQQAALDSAEHLGRVVGESPGSDLDAEATLDRTLAAAGRFEPVLQPRRLRHDIVLLIDFEEGSHPWLDAFLRLVDAWCAQGITFRRYRFHGAPDWVVDLETRRPVSLADLARQSEGLPLLVFSRQLDPAARTGTAEWLDVLGAWPRRAWLDPDPRSRDELDRYRRGAIWDLERHGLDRFHLTDREVVAMARQLAGADAGRRPVGTEAPLPPCPGDESTPVGEALRLWALVAALVPDPTWDQLEAIRRHFPEIESRWPEARSLQRLLEWVAARTGCSPELDGGRGLAIPPEQQDAWLREQRRRERDGTAAPILDRARRLLLRQLESTRPEDEADLDMWRFKRAMHEAMLEPHRAAELLRWIGESAIRHEALRWLDAELTRRAEGFGKPLPLRDRDVLASLVEAGSRTRVPLAALVGLEWPKHLAVALPLLVVSMAVVSANPWLRGAITESLGKTVSVAVEGLPPIYALEERGHLPRMVDIPAGSFMMGDADSEWDNERPVHRVGVAGFEMSKTEVTVAQYRACVEAAACDAPERSFDSCNWNVDDRDDHPMNCVSWNEAKRYADWIGARLPTEAEWEYAARSAGLDRDYPKRDADWIGARLPTEAEWEYAARSAGLDRDYPWGDEPATCDRAVISEQDLGSGCDGQPQTQAVCSRPAGDTDQGLCDMAGSVSEWVEDDWHDDYDFAPTDGSAWIDRPRASYRVIRGGSWRDTPRLVRVAVRFRGVPSNRFSFLGFRVARSVPSAVAAAPAARGEHGLDPR